MPRFVYQVLESGGRSSNGVLTAADEREAASMLRKENKTIISMHQEFAAVDDADMQNDRKKKVKRDDVIYFATQLAVLVDTGVPLADALDSMAEQSNHPGMKVMVGQISDDVKGGVEFSAALGKFPKIFSKLFISLMKASEASGTMGPMLQRVSKYLEQERDTRKQVKGAMTYPVCMLGFCVLVIIGMLVFVLPRFEKIYSGKGAMLPLPTRLLLGLSNGIMSYWPLIIIGIAAIITGGYFYLRTEEGRRFLDGVKLNVPILGQMYRKACLSRSLRTMATMISTGVGMLDGLEITAQVAGNYHYAKIWNDLSEKVKEGSTLSEHLYHNRLIPHTVAQMISAGEKTGRLGDVMERVAVFCEDDMNIAIKTVTSMIEPLMIIIMGLIVGGIAMALLLPIFNISKIVSH